MASIFSAGDRPRPRYGARAPVISVKHSAGCFDVADLPTHPPPSITSTIPSGTKPATSMRWATYSSQL